MENGDFFLNVRSLESNINVTLQLCQKQLSVPYAQQWTETEITSSSLTKKYLYIFNCSACMDFRFKSKRLKSKTFAKTSQSGCNLPLRESVLMLCNRIWPHEPIHGLKAIQFPVSFSQTPIPIRALMSQGKTTWALCTLQKSLASL